MSNAYEAPVGETETALSTLWAQLLGVERVGRHDHFFSLGGHSVLAMGMLSRLKRMLNVEVPLSELLRAPELAAFAEVVSASTVAAKAASEAPDDRVDSPLSSAQQRIWFMDQMSPGTNAYNLCWALRVTGHLDVPAIEGAVTEVERRHAVLRSVFVATKDGPAQRLMEPRAQAVTHVDLTELGREKQEAEVEQFVREQAEGSFDLQRGPLLRVHLLKLSHQEWILVVNMHHITSDGWSQEVFFRDLAELYSASVDHRLAQLSPLPMRYIDVAVREHEWFRGKQFQAQLQYWKRQLGGRSGRDQIAIDHPRPSVPTYRGKAQVCTFPRELLESLHTVARAEGATLFVVLLAALVVLLHRRNGQDDILVGTDVANRSDDTREMIGLFVNQLVLCTSVAGQPTFREVVRRVRRVCFDALAHPDVPFQRLVKELSPVRDVASNPLFQVMLVLQTATPASVQLVGAEVTPVHVPTIASPFELTVAFAETMTKSLRLECRYKADVLEDATIRLLMDQVGALLQEIARAADTPIAALAVNELTGHGEVAARQERRAAKLNRLLSTTARPIDSTLESLVEVDSESLAHGLPVIVSARLEGLDTERFAKAHGDWINEQLYRHGALLFRGFSIDSAARLASFADALTGSVMDYGERSSPRTRLQQGVFTSTDYPADQPIVLHNEQSYTLNWPMKILFACVRAADKRGRTPLADTRKVLNRLSAATASAFEESGLLYVRNYGDGLGLCWQEAFQTNDRAAVDAYCRGAHIEAVWRSGGRLQTRQRRPAIRRHPKTGERVWFNHAFFFNLTSLDGGLQRALMAGGFGVDELPFVTYYGDGSPIPAAVTEEIRGALDAETVSLPWQAGDLLLIDNMLVAHGREPYEGPRKIIVSLAEPYDSARSETEQPVANA
jgi:alpha-ketoglutarate-dependent taurine dioxygenase